MSLILIVNDVKTRLCAQVRDRTRIFGKSTGLCLTSSTKSKVTSFC